MIAGAAPVLVLALGAAAGCSPGRVAAPAPPRHVIAWNPAVPSGLQARHVRPSPPCRASRLRVVRPGLAFLPGAAGGTGTVALRNAGPGPCRLTGWPTVRLAGAPRAPAQRQVDLPAQPPAFPDVLEPASTLLALPPGATAVLAVGWRNWCVPGASRSRKPRVPPKAVRIKLGPGRGRIDVNYNAVPGCDAPGQPSTVTVRPFSPSPLPATRPWTTAGVKASIEPLDGGKSRLTGRRGQTARFVVRLRNVSDLPVRFARCPLLVEALAPAGQPEAHQLNCGATGGIPPRGTLLFEMRIQVPARAPLGNNGLFWELDPTGSQGPEAVTGLVVSR
jgi:uncharacterized protein DUF4232